MHAATDWATRDSPELAHQLHKVDNLSVRADEVLRGTAENIAMQLLACAASHVLSYVDRFDCGASPCWIDWVQAIRVPQNYQRQAYATSGT
ncbi:MAG: hypothetical protein M3P00_10275 [Gemmatimonadota bacterium]|nr:hypothetical protein [Gemmatimonadota bacterium]